LNKGKALSKKKTKFKHKSLATIIVSLGVGVFLPVLLSTAVGIVSLALGEDYSPLVGGVLIISFAAAAIGGAVVVIVLLGRRARVARLQADILTNVSHELRTPLSSIRMYAQTILRGKLDTNPKAIEDSLTTIVRQTNWLETMIDRMLIWRAASKDRDLLEMHQASLKDAIEDAVDRFTKMISPAEMDFTTELESQAPVLHDKNSISTVLLNLLINAYKYTLKDKKIRVFSHDLEDQAVVIVEDNGIGISKGDQQQIFEPFFRADSHLSGKSSGVGLGLAIVEHYIQAHAGMIEIESKPGEGSRFIIKLPTSLPEE
jgi:two-component system phosphate regulon sensor histidine kinase PhoR